MTPIVAFLYAFLLHMCKQGMLTMLRMRVGESKYTHTFIEICVHLDYIAIEWELLRLLVCGKIFVEYRDYYYIMAR